MSPYLPPFLPPDREEEKEKESQLLLKELTLRNISYLLLNIVEGRGRLTMSSQKERGRLPPYLIQALIEDRTLNVTLNVTSYVMIQQTIGLTFP